MPLAFFGDADVAAWPFSVALRVKFSHFLGSLHWPRGAGDLGVGGVPFLELFILYERWAGERLVLESAVPLGRWAGRPISVSAVPFGPGIDIGRSCRFIGSIIRFLATLPGGLARFLPCRIGAHYCRLRHLGWEKCGHGLTSRLRETSHPASLNSLLEVFGYPAGELPLSFCSGNFALRKPTWDLPEGGGVQGILTPGDPNVGLVSVRVAGDWVISGGCWTRGAGGTWNRVRLTKKTAGTLVRRCGAPHVLFGRRWKGLSWTDKVSKSSLTVKRRFESVNSRPIMTEEVYEN